MKMSELHGENTDRARSAVNQHSFPGFDLRSLQQPLPCGQCPDRHSSRSLVRERSRFARYALRRCDAKLGGRAVGKPIVQTVNFLADCEAGCMFPQLCNDTRELMP